MMTEQEYIMSSESAPVTDLNPTAVKIETRLGLTLT